MSGVILKVVLELEKASWQQFARTCVGMKARISVAMLEVVC